MMKESHKVGDHFIEYSNRDGDEVYDKKEYLIWKIKSINERGRYHCVCVEDNINAQNGNIGTIVHFYYKNYREWVELGSMEDYPIDYLPKDLFEL